MRTDGLLADRTAAHLETSTSSGGGVGEWGGDGGVWVEGARQIPGSKRGWGALIEAVAWSVFYVIG